MASAFTHAFAAVALGNMASANPRGWRFWALAAGSAVIPDADVITFAFGVDYADFFGHRGFFHSLFFALLWAVFVVLLEFRQARGRELAWLIGEGVEILPAVALTPACEAACPQAKTSDTVATATIGRTARLATIERNGAKRRLVTRL